MTTFANPSKEPSHITLSVPLTRVYYDHDYCRMRLMPSSCEYQISGNANWKIAVSSADNNVCVALYCRRKLSSDTLQAVYSVRLISNNYRRHTQDFYKQGHAIFSGSTLESTAIVDLNLDSNVLRNILSYRDTSLQMHITSLEPPAEDMSVKIYEDAFRIFAVCIGLRYFIRKQKEVYVNKTLLSLHSDWWKDTFDKFNDRVPLLNVDYDQFLDFLTVIYPTAHPITAKNVETLSKFAHDFKMTELLKRCDIFLMANNEKFGKSKLLRLAQNYNLERLQAQCINKYNSLEDVKAIITEWEYLWLNDRTKRMLLDKILGISPLALSEAPMQETSVSSGIVTNNTRASQILDKLASLSSCQSDIVLVVGNAQIPAHKHLLSYFSEFFDKMFKSEFKESRENEISLEDVRYEEMVELLSVTYPTNNTINETNIATIVKLADRFVMPIILDRCKQELKNSNKIKGTLKLWLVQQYNSISDLQAEFVCKCNSIEDVEKLKYEPEFELLDDHTRALILENITLNERDGGWSLNW